MNIWKDPLPYEHTKIDAGQFGADMSKAEVVQFGNKAIETERHELVCFFISMRSVAKLARDGRVKTSVNCVDTGFHLAILCMLG